MTTAEITALTLQLAIHEAERKLVMCEAAHKHLSGIPKRQNETRMEQLCDLLTDLRIRLIELTPDVMTDARRKVMSRGSGHV